MVNRTLNQTRDEMVSVRTSKLVRLRVGVFATGAPVGESQSPPRAVHVIAISADLHAPEGVTAYCGAHFAPGTLAEVPWGTMEPHGQCRRLSPIPAGLNQAQTDNGTKANTIVGDTHNNDSVFRESSVWVTAQWSVNNPVIYVKHAAQSNCVDLAISGPGENDVIAHFQLSSPLEVLTFGHDLISAGLSLAKMQGLDIDQLKAAIPSAWWIQDQTKSDTDADGEKSPDP